jgi:integrase
MASVFRRGKSIRKVWQAAFTDADGVRRCRSTGTTLKDHAARIAAKWEADARLRREGVIDRAAERLERFKDQSIKTWHVNFDREMRSGGASNRACDESWNLIEAVCRQAGFSRLRDIEPTAVNDAMAHLRQHGRPGSRHVALPLSDSTICCYLARVQRFTRWLHRRGQLPADPLATLKRPAPERRFKRRMLLPAEFTWLCQVLSDDPRLLLYAVAIQTGYRVSELESLTVADLVTDAQQAFIRCRRTKNGKPARQYIRRELADALLASIGERHSLPDDWLFDLQPGSWAKMLRGDVATARYRYLADGGEPTDDFLVPTNRACERLDFHSLRHSCGAWLVLSGVNVKIVQTIMRHAKIATTLDTYGHLLPGAEAEAVNVFPSIYAAEE